MNTKSLGIFIMALLLGLLSITAVSHAQSAPITEEAFWGLIIELQTAVQQLENESEEVRRQQLTAWADELEQITAVSHQGTAVPIKMTFLITKLRAEPPDLPKLDRLLTALLDAEKSWGTSQFNQNDIVPLTQILERPEFQYETETSWLQERIVDLQQRFWEFISRILPEGALDALDGTGNFLSILAAIALTGILAYALQDILFSFADNATIDPEDSFNGEPLSADLALKRAQDFSMEGDYRTAVRYLYLSVLLLLEERGLLQYNRSLTNREYLRSVTHQPELAHVLQEVIDVFDRVWYGFQSLEEAEYQIYAKQVEALKQQRGTL